MNIEAIREMLEEIAIINDHTHIFGTDPVNDFERASVFFKQLTPETLVENLSGLNMHESAATRIRNDTERLMQYHLATYENRKSIFPIRAMTRMYKEVFGFKHDCITLDNAHELVQTIKSSFELDTENIYKKLSQLSNTEIWFCNHGNPSSYVERMTIDRFRWVPYFSPTYRYINNLASSYQLDNPSTIAEIEQIIGSYLRNAQAKHRIVAIKGGAYAYQLDRPFAPNPQHIKKLLDSKIKLDKGVGDKQDRIIVEDALMFLTAKIAGMLGLPVQIHTGLIWTCKGPSRIPNVMDLTPLFYECPETKFILLHGAYPQVNEIAHLAATVSNVYAELSWVPFWAGIDFPRILGTWIDMIPNNKLLYGSDAGGLISLTHDRLTREALSMVFTSRINQGYYSKALALETGKNILRDNAIHVYNLTV